MILQRPTPTQLWQTTVYAAASSTFSRAVYGINTPNLCPDTRTTHRANILARIPQPCCHAMPRGVGDDDTFRTATLCTTSTAVFLSSELCSAISSSCLVILCLVDFFFSLSDSTCRRGSRVAAMGAGDDGPLSERIFCSLNLKYMILGQTQQCRWKGL